MKKTILILCSIILALETNAMENNKPQNNSPNFNVPKSLKFQAAYNIACASISIAGRGNIEDLNIPEEVKFIVKQIRAMISYPKMNMVLQFLLYYIDEKYCKDNVLSDQDIRYLGVALYFALTNNSIEIAKILINNFGASVSEKERNFLLINAIRNGYIEIIELLLELSIDINIISDNKTPLLLAMTSGHSEEIKRPIINLVLGRPEIKVNLNCLGNETPLILSIMQSDIKTFKLLLSKGVNVNLAWFYGTPLMHAVLENNKEMVELLLEYGAKVSTERNDGKTALMLAQEKNLQEIVQLLTQAANQQN